MISSVRRWVVCGLLFPSLVSAETMQLRTGEHEDFTRVVLAFDTLPAWQAGRTPDGYAILLDGDEPLSADTSRAFALIGRDRIRDIDVNFENRRVDIALGCECHAEIFQLNNVRLVIDIKDGAIGPGARHELPVDVQAQPRPPKSPSMPLVPELLAPQLEPRRSIAGGRGDTPVLPILDPPELPAPHSDLEQRAAAAIDELSPRTDALRSFTNFDSFIPNVDRLPTVSSPAVEAITQQLGRAASQGLVQVETRADALPPATETEAIPGPRNFRVFTGYDRDTQRIDQSASSTSQGQGCIPDRYVDLLSWGDPARGARLGEFRQSIVKETGAIDHDAMRELAQYYIVLGFGAEARFALEQLPLSEERNILIALSEIVDKGSSDADFFAGQIACPGKIALWAAIARPFKRGELPISADGILKTFSALPPHLREHLGPILSQRLRSAGETALARAALSAVTRIGSGSVGQELTAARLELLGTRASEARAELERISQGTNVAAAEALIELLQDAARRRVPPKPEWVNDADTLIRVTEGTDVADQLSVAALRGHIPLGRFDDLRRALFQGRPGLTPSIRTDISAEALGVAVLDADDATFLRTELGLSDFASPEVLDASRRYDMVRRFLGLGLPELAAKYLPVEMETADEIRLAAETFSALDRRAFALTLVGNTDDRELEDVRAELLAQVRNFEAAAKALENLGEARAAEIQALRSGDWDWIADDGPQRLSLTARTAISKPITESDSQGVNVALLEDVSGRYAAFLELLEITRPVNQR